MHHGQNRGEVKIRKFCRNSMEMYKFCVVEEIYKFCGKTGEYASLT